MPDLLFPILTGLSLVFAGILVGYFLWFRDRSEQIIFGEQLATENETLRQKLLARDAEVSSIVDDLSRTEAKTGSLQQLCDDLLSSKEQVQQRSNDLELELFNARKEIDASGRQIADLKSRNDELLRSGRTEEAIEQEVVLRLEQAWSIKLSESESKGQQYEADAERLRDVNVQLTERLHEAKSEIAELKSELTNQKAILETAKKNAVGLEKEYVSLETSLRSQAEILNESRGQTAAANSARTIAEETLTQRNAEIVGLKTEIERLGQTEQELAISHQAMNKLKLQLEHENARRLQLESELVDREKKIESDRGTMEDLESKLIEFNRISCRCEHLEGSLTLATERTNSLMEQRDAFADKGNSLAVENDSLKTRIENQLATIEKLTTQSEATENRRKKHQQKLLDQIQELESTNQKLNRENGEQRQTIADAEQWRVRNNDALKRISEENAVLLSKLSEFEKLNSESLIASEEYRSRIESVLQQRDAAMNDLTQLKTELKKQRQLSRRNEETIRNLRRERVAVLMRGRQQMSAYPRIHDASLEFSTADDLAKEYGGTIANDPVKGPVFVEAPRKRDDLKRIYGIADVLERKLNYFGIYTFKQIMNWDEKNIREFSELLAFRDRIERDNWIKQATELYNNSQSQHAA